MKRQLPKEFLRFGQGEVLLRERFIDNKAVIRSEAIMFWILFNSFEQEIRGERGRRIKGVDEAASVVADLFDPEFFGVGLDR